MPQTVNNSGTISNVPVTTTTEIPDYVDIDPANSTASVTLSHDISLGAQDSSDINIALAIDTSGSTRGDSGSDLDGDGTNETFLEAQVYAARELFQTYVDLGYDPSRVTITLVDYSGGADVVGVYTLDQINDFNGALDQILADGPDGSTNYEAGLDAINDSWTTQGVSSTASNNVVFLSDGVRTSGGQFTDDATALESNFGANISAVGVGANATLTGGLNEMDNTGGSIGAQDGAVQVTDASQLANVISSPPPIVDVDSVTVTVTYDDPNNPGSTLTYTETIPVGDPRLTPTPSGYAFNDLEFEFAPPPPAPSTAHVEVVTTFNDGSDFISTGQIDIPAYICFARGTLIQTDTGAVAVEKLAEGHLVMTRDSGLQPIRWIGSSTLSTAALAGNEKLRPIRIRRGALGDNIPTKDLVVSPQHRVLVRSKIAQRMFGTNEVLVAAKQLCEIDGIDIATDAEDVEYFHILFDRHEVIFSNGAETESLYTGPEALKSVGKAAREEILALFPELIGRDYEAVSARVLTTGRMGRKCAARHSRNRKLLVAAGSS